MSTAGVSVKASCTKGVRCRFTQAKTCEDSGVSSISMKAGGSFAFVHYGSKYRPKWIKASSKVDYSFKSI
jgi:hypothetical protein